MKISPDQIPSCPTTLLRLGRYNVTLHSVISLQGRGYEIVNGKSVAPVDGRYCLRLMYNVGGMDCEPADDETRALLSDAPEPEAAPEPDPVEPPDCEPVLPPKPDTEPPAPDLPPPSFAPAIGHAGTMADLRDDARDLGIKVDGRWKRERLENEIAAALAKD